MKKRNVLLLASILPLTGCGYIHRHLAFWTDYSMICIEETHVEYIQFSSGAAPLIDQAGKPVPCR